jgi:hypothetical protein
MNNQCQLLPMQLRNYKKNCIYQQKSNLPSIILWYSSVFSMFDVLCAASLALAALEGKWGPCDDMGEQYSTFTMCL